MRQDYKKIQSLGAEVIALGPDGPNSFKRYWAENQMPFIGLADIRSRVAEQYHQEVNLWKMGRMPAQMVVDLKGQIRYRHYGESMQDIASNEEVMGVLRQLQTER